MKVPQLKHESLREAVVRLIEEALLNGDLQPGDRIIETELAERAGISRGPVREAIRQLVGEGILVSYPSRGTFVVQWTPRAVEEAYTLRAVLEQFAIQEAVRRVTHGGIAQLQATVDEMDRSAQLNDVKALVRLDVQFHEQLYALSGHSLLQKTLSQLRRRLYWVIAMDQGYADHRDEIAMDHQAIVDALKAGDATVAGEIIADHVLTIGDEVVERIQNWPNE